MTSLKLSAPAWERTRGQSSAESNVAPIRAEVFGIDRLEEHARVLAQQDQILPPVTRGQRPLRRLNDNRTALFAAQKRFAEVARAGQPLSPAAEWLLDNFYIVQEQLRQIEQDLSHSYYHE